MLAHFVHLSLINEKVVEGNQELVHHVSCPPHVDSGSEIYHVGDKFKSYTDFGIFSPKNTTDISAISITLQTIQKRQYCTVPYFAKKVVRTGTVMVQ